MALGNGALAPTRDFPFSPATQRTDLSQLLHISRQFQIHGEILHAEQCKVGHINKAYTATYDQGGTQVRYIHQRINHGVFKKPADVMDDLMRVTTHPRRKLAEAGVKDLTRRALTVVPTNDGESLHKTRDGEYWRTFVFIERVRTFEAVETVAQAFEAGRAFGEFQGLLVALLDRCRTQFRLVESIARQEEAMQKFADGV